MTTVDLTDMELATPIEIEHAPTQLATISTVIDGVAMMDESEAREYLKMMQWDLEAADSALVNFRARALDFAEREGWRVLGYAGALEALQTELGAQHSKSYLSRILQAGEIERVLDLPIGQLPERTLRPLAQLDTPDQQIAAYQVATSNGKPTAKKMQQAVDQIKPQPVHYQKLPPPIELPIPTGDDALDDAALAAGIRELAEPLGLLMIWEDGRVLLYWPDEADDIEQMDLLSYGAALEWLKWEAVGIKADRDEAAATTITIESLDASLPTALRNAGYFWRSATPPTIAHSSGKWQADAPTVDGALGAAHSRERAKATLTLVLDLRQKEDCPFPGFPTDMPTLMESIRLLLKATDQWGPGSQRKVAPALAVLRVAARAALEASE